MSQISDAKFEGIDFDKSYVLGVIYDDESLTLELDFNLTPAHRAYSPPQDGAEGCYRGGYVRFADIQDLQIDKAKGPDGGEVEDYSTIYSVSGDGENFEFSCGWGEIKVAAKSVRIALD
jgi:hypothetical protein